MISPPSTLCMADTHVSVVAVDVLSAPTTYVFAVISIANVFRAGFGIRAAKNWTGFSQGLPVSRTSATGRLASQKTTLSLQSGSLRESWPAGRTASAEKLASRAHGQKLAPQAQTGLEIVPAKFCVQFLWPIFLWGEAVQICTILIVNEKLDSSGKNWTRKLDTKLDSAGQKIGLAGGKANFCSWPGPGPLDLRHSGPTPIRAAPLHAVMCLSSFGLTQSVQCLSMWGLPEPIFGFLG